MDCGALAAPFPIWQGSRRLSDHAVFTAVSDRPARFGSSVVEHPLGKGEVESSILSRSTSQSLLPHPCKIARRGARETKSQGDASTREKCTQVNVAQGKLSPS